MQRRTMKRLQGLIGLLLILVAVGGIVAWEVYGRDTFLSDEIIVLKNDVNVHEVITEDILMKVKRPKDSLSIRETFKIEESQVIYNYNQIIGLVAKHYIPEGQTLVWEYFTQNQLLPQDGQYTFPLPKEWIMAMPGSLRRGDKITLYPFLKEREKLRDALMAAFSESTKNTNLDDLEQEILEEEIVPMVVSQEKLKVLIKEFKEELETFTFTALHVKDGSNKEVVSIDYQEPEDKRFNGSSNIREVEIITTDEEVSKMNELIDKGYVFIIMYQN